MVDSNSIRPFGFSFNFRDMTLICRAIDTTRDLIACHDSDTRYDNESCRSAVAALYLPIAGLVVGALHQLHGYGTEHSFSFTPDVAMAIATSSISTLMGSDDNRGEFASQVVSKLLESFPFFV